MRSVDDAEEAAVLAFFDGAVAGLARRVTKDRVLLLDDDGRVHLASPALLELPVELLVDAEIGLPIGHLDDEGFRLDLQGAVLMAKHTEVQSVRVSEKAARLALYGRDVFGDSILWHARGIGLGDAVLILNPRGEALGIGEVVGTFKGARPAVRPLHDLGAYLRDQS